MKCLIRLFPFNYLSRIVGMLVESCLSRIFIKAYAWLYGIDLLAATRQPGAYRTLGDFFVREIRPELRPLGDGVLSPVDGVLRSFGGIEAGQIAGVKGRDYSLSALLADDTLALRHNRGSFFNFYLSPADCHHVFAPFACEMISTKHVPGRLFPVNDWGCAMIPELFSQNRRVVISCKTSIGLMTVIMVGATNVGRLEVNERAAYAAGDKMGTFFLGSSVVLLFEPDSLKPDSSLRTGGHLLYGQTIAQPLISAA